MTVQANLESIHARIQQALLKAGRPLGSVRLIGVTKKQALEKLEEAIRAGLWDFGENYVQEWKTKKLQLQQQHPEISRQLHWHFIGHLQSNKAAEVVGEAEFIHGVDSLKLAQKISALAEKKGVTQKVLFEINLAQEKSKTGMTPQYLMENLISLSALPHLALEGLMAIPPVLENLEKVRPYFIQLKSLLDECNRLRVLEVPMRELSMGMSQDFEVAIEEGSTMVRIGTALFGERNE